MRRIAIAIVFAAALPASAGTTPSADWAAAQPVTIELSNFKFTPSTLTLHRGVAYRIHLLNKASGGHNFVAKEFFAQSTVAPEDRGKLKSGGIGLDGGEAADFRLVPQQAGTYKIRCTHFLHSSFGMTGTVVVQ